MDNNQIAVSVIVPVYNVGDYLEECLESLVNQTMKEIEIICVDDCSTDGSIDILRKYEEKYSNIKVKYHSQNLSTSQSRKDAAGMSQGKYVMFVDGDDHLELNACEVAYAAIEKSKTDIVQFNTKVINCGGLPQERITMNQNLLLPNIERFQGENLIRACWETNIFGFTLWNKIYNGDVVRKAFSMVKDGSFPKAQDLYAFFIIAYYAKSYFGIEDTLYNYKLGTGVTGQSIMTMEQFKVLLTEQRICKQLDDFLKEVNAYEEYKDITEQIRIRLFNECVNRWMNNLETGCAQEGFDELKRVWGEKELIPGLARTQWYNRNVFAEKSVCLNDFKGLHKDYKGVKTIAAYYHSIKNGGAQRVVSILCNLWAEMQDAQGNPLYNVILITDEETEENDIAEYELNPKIKREYLPNHGVAVKEQYGERYEAWNRILDKYKIDVVVDSLWIAPSTLWDMLTIKAHPSKPAFVMHIHSFCCFPYRLTGNEGTEMMYKYQLCDGIVTLSECDNRFVSIFANNTKCILNPLTFEEVKGLKEAKEPHSVVWVGRISKEKNPLDVIHMMNHLIKKVPDAKLYVVGSGDKEIEESMKGLIGFYKLENNISLEGFQSDVAKYYVKAEVLIGTSAYEGFSMVYCEAMNYKVPVITYDMPWLTLVRDGRGVFTVPQNRYDLMAEKVSELLLDEEMLKHASEQAKEHVEEIRNEDLAGQWKEVFDGIGKEYPPREKSTEDILLEYMTLFQQIGRKNAVGEVNGKLKRTYTEKSSINRKLQITYKEKAERGITIKELQKEIDELKEKERRRVMNRAKRLVKRVIRRP